MKAKATLLALCALLGGGCAKFPDTPVTGSTRLIFNFDVDGAIRTGSEVGGTGVPYIYMIALRFTDQDNPPDAGPSPVVSPPWGNGFVSGKATHFIWWDPTVGNEFLIYRFNNPDTLTEWLPIGVPISAQHVNIGDKRIRFELELAQLYPVQAERDALRTVMVNILTMDRIPQTGSSKEWDALGDSRNIASLNNWVNIPLRTSATYNDTLAGDLEPQGDQANPDLDVVDWSVEVRLQ